MSIKQNGGVFGRNPTFNDVTIEGQLTFDGDIDINSDLTIGGDLEVNGSITAKKAGTALVADRTGSNGIIQSWQKDSVDVASMKVDGDVYFNTPNSGIRFNANALIPTKNSAVSNGGVSLGSAIYQYNNAYLSGNVILASGSGIDFSATAGTGTSELLDDYEEGAWTPVVTGSTSAGTGTYINQIGLYTKVGRVVHFQCWLQVSAHTGTGVTLINGLPFTSNASDAKGTGNLNYFANLTISASNTAGLQVANGQTYLVLKEFPVGGGVSGSVAIDPNMQINFSGSYTV